MVRYLPLLLLGLLALVPLTGEFRGLIGSLAVIFGLVALGFVVLTGWTGDVSLGQIVPYGLGAYSTFFLIDKAHFPVALAIVGAAVITLPAVVVIGIPALRLRGLDLAIATFALALIAQLVVFKNLGRALASQHGGLTEFSSSVVRVDRPSIGPIDIDTNVRFYLFALALAAVVYLLVVALGRSAFGRALLAVRDDPVRAEVLGLPVARYRLLAFVVAGTIAALAGALAASLRQAVTADTFTIFESLNFLAMAVIGGLTVARGAVLGGIFGAVLPEIARQDPFRFLQGRLILVYGLALMLLLAFRPGGLASALGWDRRPAPRLPAPKPPGARPRVRTRHSLLRVDDLAVAFGGVRAVDGVTLRVADGEAVAMIGPNGAGKSTLFDAITGLLPPTHGRVYFRGVDVTMMAPHRRADLGLARTFQAARVFPSLTVAENLVAAAALRILPGETPEADAASLLARLGLGDAAGELPTALPFGSLRTLEVGLALASHPRLLLLDEPTAGMDRTDAERLCALLDELRADIGLALVLVEHDMGIVGLLAERVIVLDQGRVIADGSPRSIARDPAVVASYLGTTADQLGRQRKKPREKARA